eukprot:4498208-Pyramimonas_sp.AAC.1
MKINPACRPFAGDVSERCRAVQRDVDCTAMHSRGDVFSRQRARTVFRKEPGLSYQSEEKYLKEVLRSETISTS